MADLYMIAIIGVLSAGYIHHVTGENTVHACLNQYVALKCSASPDCIVALVRAQYGHPSRSSSPTAAANCTSAQPVCFTNASDVWVTCHRQVACAFHVRQQRAKENCSQSSNQLVLKYSCQCPANCKSLPEPAFGYVEYDNPYLAMGTEARIHCDPGYHLTGNPLRRCQDGGRWSGIQPACSVPLEVCPKSTYDVIAYGGSCFELVEKSRNWTSAKDDCRMKNASLAHNSSTEEFEFFRWWLEDRNLFGYVWVGLPDQVPPTICPELARSQGDDGETWRFKSGGQCSYLNRYICQYDRSYHYNATRPEDDFMVIKKRDLALGLGLGVGLLVTAILLPVVIVCCVRRRNKDMEIDPYASVTDPGPRLDQDTVHPDYDESYPDVSLDDPDFDMDPDYDDTRDMVRVQVDSCADPQGCANAVYDDVYVTSRVGMVQGRQDRGSPTPASTPTASRATAPDGRAPKLPRRVQRGQPGYKGHHRNPYENVLLHNLTESLKRKLLPRKFSNRRKARESVRERRRRGVKVNDIAETNEIPAAALSDPAGSTAPHAKTGPPALAVRQMNGASPPRDPQSLEAAPALAGYGERLEGPVTARYKVDRESDVLHVLENELYNEKHGNDMEFAQTEL